MMMKNDPRTSSALILTCYRNHISGMGRQKTTLQDATELQHIAANEASEARSLPGAKKITVQNATELQHLSINEALRTEILPGKQARKKLLCKMQRNCNILLYN
jgi:hypothetical protein